MLGNAKIRLVNELVADLSRDEIIWLNGYLTGLLGRPPQTLPVEGLSNPQPSPVEESNKNVESPHSEERSADGLSTGKVGTGRITLAYGTETGNAKKLAIALAGKAKKSGVQVKLVSLDQYKPADLLKEELFFVVISTQGEGEPPVGAKKFYDALFAGGLALPNLKYAVLGLGDAAYPLFCKTGEDVNAQLQKLGGNRLAPLQKCDVDYEEDADKWFDTVLNTVKSADAPKEVVAAKPSTAAVPAAPKVKGKRYYEGKILTNINLNGRGSKKQTFHIEIGVNEVVEYEPGDSLAIVPQNRKAVVEEIIKLTGIDRNLVLATEKHNGTVEELLTKELNVCYLLTSTIKSYAEITGQQIPDTRMDFKDLLRIYPVKDAAQGAEVIKLLKSIAPRLYSISSSPSVHEGELHLTVGKHSFLLEDNQHFGLCSEFMGEIEVGTVFRFYIHKNRAFKLPAPEKDIVMIGPGIGIAPYRSFVAERDAQGATGRSWLFFGEQHFATDFLYQTEWQSYLATGSLTKMNVAFSRDGEERIYVEHKMLQHAKELFEWIEGGASVYLCGEKGPLHEKVESALKQIIKEGKNISEEEAAKYFAELKKAGRYEKEVF
ncbi:diflavin oxidoreductase [Flavisolibacter ginsenosidimutans]|uniref:assimilatory sulfite reductase (NADPH) n=1 Tax=Flavisolibacter ginsenosidimutans TaxID=661481 RepID=A0A5B8UIR3_9BACT|nr:flavodoxin domain-containing protein [Flavisolibacter ginsenosidimutans]QEC55895.1 sulfite reductase [Flavisolibacter ginsenosidimutans]